MIDYRDATPADGSALDEMARTVWLETFGNTAPPDDIAHYLGQAYGPEGRLIADLTDGSARFRLAVESDRIVGYAKIVAPWLPDAEAGAVQLSQLYVTYDQHGTGRRRHADGLGDRDRPRATDAPALLLTVWENNAPRDPLLRRARVRARRRLCVSGRRSRSTPITSCGSRCDGGCRQSRRRWPACRTASLAGAAASRPASARGWTWAGAARRRYRPSLPRTAAAPSPRSLPGATLLTLYQVHSADCVAVRDALRRRLRPHADALVTDRPGLLLGILTADCAPVLFADAEAGVVGAAHAGWKGAIGGVTDATIAAMESLGARRDRIVAAIGPCIARASYEVDDGFRAPLRARPTPPTNASSPTAAPATTSSTWKPMSPTASPPPGIGRVETLGLDTYADAARFFSYRRATHRGEPDYGRQISLIGGRRRSRPMSESPTDETEADLTGAPQRRAPSRTRRSRGRKLKPSTLMMGHGYRSRAVGRIAEAADLPDLDLRLSQRGGGQAPLRGRHRQAPGRRRGPRLFALQRPQPGNPRGPARGLGGCRGRARLFQRHVGDRDAVPRDGQARRHHRPFRPALCRDRNADRAHPRQVRRQLARLPRRRDPRGDRRGDDRGGAAATSR